jgi:predicted RNA binding protein YcfA (HicA-like mRNA interferase family)
MKYSELERKLKASGCHWVEDGGKHPIWFSPVTGNKFPTSYHKSQEVKRGTLKSILHLAGVKL